MPINPAAENTDRVLLINGLWRAGTTYAWSKIRENASWRCYYEPLHEVLSLYEPSRDENYLRDEVWKMMRHPSLVKGYFAEYPLLESGLGVPLYTDSMAYERFLLSPSDDDPALEAYLRSLIDYARTFGQRTCLQPNRLFLRSTWFRSRFPTLHVYLSRDWWDLWKSMLSFPNSYFPSRYYLVATRNASHPIIRPLVDGKDLPAAETIMYTGEEPQLAPWILNRQEAFRFFYYIYVCTSVLCCADAEAVVDLSLGDEPARVWAPVEPHFAAEGIKTDFSDFTMPAYPKDDDFAALEGIATEIEALILEKTPDVRIPAGRIPASLPEHSRLKQLLQRFSV